MGVTPRAVSVLKWFGTLRRYTHLLYAYNADDVDDNEPASGFYEVLGVYKR